jgi:ABC-type transporter lipoprotein component MlaA
MGDGSSSRRARLVVAARACRLTADRPQRGEQVHGFAHALGHPATEETGTYLVLPLFPPSTVRDTIGSTIDGLLDALGLVMPLAGRIVERVGTTVSDRSMNLELVNEVEESVLNLYSRMWNLSLQRRERAFSNERGSFQKGTARSGPEPPSPLTPTKPTPGRIGAGHET